MNKLKKYCLISFVVLGCIFFSSSVFGASFYAIQFDGWNDDPIFDYITIPDNPAYDVGSTTDFSVSAVFRTTSLADSPDIVSKYYEGDYIGWDLYGNAGQVAWYMTDGSLHANINASVDVEDNEWHTLTGKRVGSESQLWLDGSMVASETFLALGDIDGNPNIVIPSNTDGEYWFLGDIREVKIIVDGVVVGWWDFHDGEGTTLTDISGVGNDGVITNGTWIEVFGASYILPVGMDFVPEVLGYVARVFGDFSWLAYLWLGLVIGFVIIDSVISLVRKRFR